MAPAFSHSATSPTAKTSMCRRVDAEVDGAPKMRQETTSAHRSRCRPSTKVRAKPRYLPLIDCALAQAVTHGDAGGNFEKECF